MSRSKRPLLLGPLGAAVLALSAAGTALAGPEASVSVFNADGTPAGATVCAFYVEFNPLPGGEAGSWEIWNSSGTMVADGEYEVTATEADREPDTGAFELPNGTYTFMWDDETPIDTSRERITIEVACVTETPAPTPFQSVEGETDAPTGTPFQSVEGETDAPTPFQSVEGETDVPPTLPDTTALETARPDAAIWPGVIVIAFSLLAAILVLTPDRRRRNR